MPSVWGSTPELGVVPRNEGVPPSIGLLECAFHQGDFVPCEPPPRRTGAQTCREQGLSQGTAISWKDGAARRARAGRPRSGAQRPNLAQSPGPRASRPRLGYWNAPSTKGILFHASHHPGRRGADVQGTRAFPRDSDLVEGRRCAPCEGGTPSVRGSTPELGAIPRSEGKMPSVRGATPELGAIPRSEGNMPSVWGATPELGVVPRTEGVPPSIGLLECAFHQGDFVPCEPPPRRTGAQTCREQGLSQGTAISWKDGAARRARAGRPRSGAQRPNLALSPGARERCPRSGAQRPNLALSPGARATCPRFGAQRPNLALSPGPRASRPRLGYWNAPSTKGILFHASHHPGAPGRGRAGNKGFPNGQRSRGGTALRTVPYLGQTSWCKRGLGGVGLN